MKAINGEKFTFSKGKITVVTTKIPHLREKGYAYLFYSLNLYNTGGKLDDES